MKIAYGKTDSDVIAKIKGTFQERPKRAPVDKKKGKKGQGNVKVSQPISQQQPQSAMNQSMNSMGTTSISSLPQQSSPDFNSMYQNDNTPLVGAATPGMDGSTPRKNRWDLTPSGQVATSGSSGLNTPSRFSQARAGFGSETPTPGRWS